MTKIPYISPVFYKKKIVISIQGKTDPAKFFFTEDNVQLLKKNGDFPH